MSSITTLLVTCWFPNNDNPQWGTFVLDHARSLSKSGSQARVLFIHIHAGNATFQLQEESYEIKGIPVLKIEITSCFWKFLYQWPLFLRSKILQFSEKAFIAEADVIHAHALFPAGFFGWQLSQKLKKPFVLTEHWSRATSFLSRHPLGYYGKKIYRQADAVIFVSEYLKQQIEAKVRPANSFVIANPIDDTLFRYKPKPETPPIRFVLAALWKKNSVKRGDLVLKAFHEIQQETNIPFHLDFIGTGTSLEEYKQMAEDFGLPVTFCGFLEKEKLAGHFQQSQFFLHPTEFETFGIVVFEALKTGTPALVSHLKVFEPYINPTNGMLVENTVTSWKKAIMKAVQEAYSNENIASQFKDPFSEKEIADATRKVYNFVLGKKEVHK